MKYSIRDLLLVTVIAAVCVAWWLDRSRLAESAAGSKARAAASEARMTRAEQWSDAMQKAFETTAVENVGLKRKVERFELAYPPPTPSEMDKIDAAFLEKIRDSLHSERTYTLPGPPVLDNPPEL